MNENASVDDMTVVSAKRGKDRRTRRILVSVVALWLVTLAALIGIAWKGYFDQKEKTLTLAQQIAAACDSGDFGPGVSAEDQDALCSNAAKVIDNNPDVSTIQGPRGPQGETGPRGPQGFPGIQGLPGRNGQDGADGNTGAIGKTGANGQNGSDGEDGLNGAPGANGADGAMGPPGPAGPAGADGKDGADGATGPAGPQGETGVVAVKAVGCEGPIIKSLTTSYDEATRTITITCT